MLDLGPKSYLGAYAIYYEGLADAIGEDVKSEFDTSGDETVDRAVDEALGRLTSAMKLMNLDQQIAMDTYIYSYSEHVEAQLEKRSKLQQEVREEVEAPIGELQADTERVVESTDQIAALAHQEAESASEVANEVGNLSATVEEVASTTDDVATRSERADELAREGRDRHHGGRHGRGRRGHRRCRGTSRPTHGDRRDRRRHRSIDRFDGNGLMDRRS
jgi:heme-based aerotactic transducer